MDLEQAERFVAAAERDYRAMVGTYRALVTESSRFDVDEVRDARADVLAAQQVLLLARSEEESARQAADRGHGGAQGMAKWTSGMAEMARSEARGARRRDAREEEVACPRCGRVVMSAFLFDSWARGVKWCASCDAMEEDAGR